MELIDGIGDGMRVDSDLVRASFSFSFFSLHCVNRIVGERQWSRDEMVLRTGGWKSG